MKLVITEDEIKEALMRWARARYGDDFNEVDFNFGYGTLQGATFSRREPPENLIDQALAINQANQDEMAETIKRLTSQALADNEANPS